MEQDVQKSFIQQNIVNVDDDKLKEIFQDFQEFMIIYSCAIREVRTKFEVLNDHLTVTYKRNPIEMIKSRVKKPQSIVEKLKRKGLELSTESAIQNLNDVAGVRVICSFVNDIYEVANMLASQDDVTVLEVKNYIENPKPNGYRSYHMIIEVPVFFADNKQYVKVEVQLRTIAMDFWASLEHSMKYKKDVAEPEEIVAELKKCADLIAETDLKMQSINEQINGSKEIFNKEFKSLSIY
ncbi:MAG: GTP pyrophosphokinase family protein [Clostridia bacterium]|nr:GTP pyrophosphokinase family protein [Clostridia bacterium]